MGALMLKQLIFIFCLTLYSQVIFASQLDGKSLLPASNAALQEASTIVSLDSIYAWEAELEGDEVITKILNVVDVQLTYGCHFHSEEMFCHQESQNQGDQRYHKDPEVTLDYVKSGHQAAISKFERTLQRQGSDLSVMSSIKVWSHEEGGGDDGHEHGADVWTKIIYTQKNEIKTIFVLCHVHGQDQMFSCHYNNSGKGEPQLSFSAL